MKYTLEYDDNLWTITTDEYLTEQHARMLRQISKCFASLGVWGNNTTTVKEVQGND